MRDARRLSRVAVTLCAALFLFPSFAVSAPIDTGTISGRIIDEEGRPIAYTSVLVLGTSWGAMSGLDGIYAIHHVPTGIYALKVMMAGYEDEFLVDVQVNRGSTTTADFSLTSTAYVLPDIIEIVDTGKKLIEEPQVRHQLEPKDAAGLPFDEIRDLLGLKAGVVARGEEFNIRGGRVGETQSKFDDVPVRDPLIGTTVSLASLAVQSVDMIVGGFDAQHGGAQSGIINYRTKEGGPHFGGEIYYLTDDYGQPDNTFDNLDRVFLGLGGPTPIKDLTYYVSAEGTYQDDYPRTSERRSRHRILNFISVGDRKNNSIRLQGKLAYRISSSYKLTAEVIQNDSRSDQYTHAWSRAGYVQTFRDTTQTGEVVTRHGRWSPTAVDSTYVYYNAAEHTPDNENGFRHTKLVWTHTIDANTFYSLKLARNHFMAEQSVDGKKPWEYEGSSDRDFYYNYYDGESSDFFVTWGDLPFYSHRDTKVYLGMADLTKKHGAHTFQTGLEAVYNDMQYMQVDRPYQSNSDGEIGATRTRYHYYNPEGAFYVQDRWEHEGMILNVGLRYDVLSVGDQIPISEVRERVKQQLSPRVGIAYPISDKDVFSFHYGHVSQFPDRQYLYDDRGVLDGRVRGNPNLETETTISYQAGIQHLFTEEVRGQFGVYYRDMFGLLTTEEMPVLGSVGNIPVRVNQDYASARGFEATLRRSFASNFQLEVNYAFGVATGVGSDPDTRVSQNFTYLPVSEQALPWDVRHTASAQLYLADPGHWGAGFVWRFNTGFPFTPIERTTREIEPETVNSRRLPAQTALDVQAEKYYTVWGQPFKIFLQSTNILDARNITNLEPGNAFAGTALRGNDYAIYYTETGRAGGAYIGDDANGDGIEDFVPLNDPRVFGSPRSIRMGVSFSF